MSDPTSHYFGGDKVRDGRVRRLSATTFKEMVDKYIKLPVSFSMTRAEFLAHPDRDKLKDIPMLVPCAYPFDEGKREDFTAESFSMVVLDLDEGDHAKNLFDAPHLIGEYLYPYNYVCYSTAKHTPELPRLRIIVDIKATEPALYRSVMRAIAHKLGLPRDFNGSRESGVLSQPAYRPMQFNGEEFTALVGYRTDMQSVDPNDLDLTHRDVDHEGRTYACDVEDGILSLAFMPVMGVTVEDIREPLFAIDADCTYKQWIEVASALRHQFTDEDEARQAYIIFDEWSATGSKYKDDKDTYGKWRSFKPYAAGRNPITLRTLFKHAMDSGWENTKVAIKIKINVTDWINSVGDKDLLMEEGAKRIAALPFANEMVEEALVIVLRRRIEELGGDKIDKATIRKQVKHARYKERAESVRGDRASWVTPFCFIGPENTFRNNVTGSKYLPSAFDNSFSRYLIPPKTSEDEEVNNKPVTTPTSKALNEEQIRVVDGETYDPRHGGAEPYFEHDGKTFVNTYLRSSLPKEEPEHSDLAGKLFTELVRTNILNHDYGNMLISFFAFIVQNPGVKIRWTILLQGVQGCGKGTLVDCLVAAIGPANYKVVTAGAIASDFNDWRRGAQLVYLDELKSPGKNRHETANKLKDAITNDTVTVNQKFKDVACIQNITNYICTTNNTDALAMEDGDRRYMVLLSNLQFKHQTMALNETGLLEEIHTLRAKHPGAFRSFFLGYKIPDDFPVNGPAPDTVFRQDMIEESKNVLHRLVEQLIRSKKEPLIGEDLIHYAHLASRVASLGNHHGNADHYLRMLGYKKITSDPVEVDGVDTHIFAHCLNYVEDLCTPQELLEMRAERWNNRPL